MRSPRSAWRAGIVEADDEIDDSVHENAWLRLLDPPDPDRPETLGRLGSYEVLEVLGQGGMGVVLKARDPALDRTVAIKVLTPALAHAATARRRFAREARAAAAVGHEHIVAIHAVDEFRGLPYLVMQYIPGRSLQERLDASGPLEVKEILRIGTQAARALAAAHAQGVVHRDIKPANILLENCVERVKLTDFGLARAIDDASLTQSGVIAGTPQYMAPEQARGEPVDARADLFSPRRGALRDGRRPAALPGRLGDGRAQARLRRPPPFDPRAQSRRPGLARGRDRPPAGQGPGGPVPVGRRGRRPARARAGPRPAADGRAPTGRSRSPSSRHVHAARIRPPRRQDPAPSHRRLAMAAGLLLLAMAGLGASEAAGLTQVSEFVATILRIKTPEGTLVVKVDDPGVKVDVDNEVVIIGGAGPQEVRLRKGMHRCRRRGTASRSGMSWSRS